MDKIKVNDVNYFSELIPKGKVIPAWFMRIRSNSNQRKNISHLLTAGSNIYVFRIGGRMLSYFDGEYSQVITCPVTWKLADVTIMGNPYGKGKCMHFTDKSILLDHAWLYAPKNHLLSDLIEASNNE